MKKYRKCIGCGELKSQEELIKITREHKSGKVFINPDTKTFGRSVYLCYNQNCIENGLKKSRINKALKSNANFGKEDFSKWL